MDGSAHESNLIAGHTVEFPHKPYGVQFSFCAKMLQALSNQSNALLEAPTGSGKTLSLLCSALAWQFKLKLDGYTEAWEKKGQTENSKDEEKQYAREADPRAASRLSKRVPKIFYATRTHSQITQVIRELKHTHYRPKMAILAARDHYCINKQVASKPNLEEECDKLLSSDGPSCSYYSNVNKLHGTQTSLTLKVHDIEDLATAGRHHKACPYFASRHFAAEADLVFCPYSYLLDPAVRSAMDVDISNAVLIFDEAHNIEDTCRVAGSAEIELQTLEDVLASFQNLQDAGIDPELYGGLGNAVRQVVRWLRMLSSSSRLKNTEGQHHELVLAGNEAIEELGEAGLNEEQVELLWDMYMRARAEEDRAKGRGGSNAGSTPGKAACLGGLSLGVMSRLLITLHLMYRSPTRRCRDYRLAVQRWMPAPAAASHRHKGRGRHRAGTGDGDQPGWKVQMCLWSLNPAVAFADVAAKARSIILTSGTLSPLDSFASELGADFAVRFEGSHVVNLQEQVWVAALPRPCGIQPLTVTYQSTGNVAVQDAIGQCVLNAARIVPDGMLVFLSSYSLLDRLVQRWQATSTWKELSSLKRIVSEPRGTGGAFDGVMKDYYGAIDTGRGAIMFAIFRGKVSEGLDFADANARAVICVGVPLPSWKDSKVQLKKQYNNEMARTNPAVLSGEAWYTQQAFRALNQAVGRCIRHKGDFGAIMLLDERFQQPRYQKPLSRWVKGTMRIQQDPVGAMAELQAFFSRLHINSRALPQQVKAEAPVVHAATPTAEEMASKQQTTLRSAWEKPKRLNPLLHSIATPAYLTPKANAAKFGSLKANPDKAANKSNSRSDSTADRLDNSQLSLQRSEDSRHPPPHPSEHWQQGPGQQVLPGLSRLTPGACAALGYPTQTRGRGAEGAWPVMTAAQRLPLPNVPQQAAGQPMQHAQPQQLSRLSADAAHVATAGSSALQPAQPDPAQQHTHQQHPHPHQVPPQPAGSSVPPAASLLHTAADSKRLAPARPASGSDRHIREPDGMSQLNCKAGISANETTCSNPSEASYCSSRPSQNGQIQHGGLDGPAGHASCSQPHAEGLGEHVGFRRLSDLLPSSNTPMEDSSHHSQPGMGRSLQQWQQAQAPLVASLCNASSHGMHSHHQQHMPSGQLHLHHSQHPSCSPASQPSGSAAGQYNSLHGNSRATLIGAAVPAAGRQAAGRSEPPAPALQYLQQLLCHGLASQWLDSDLAGYMSFLLGNDRLINKEQACLHDKACAGILECFEMVRERVSSKGSIQEALAQVQAAWCCNMPRGLECLGKVLGVASCGAAHLQESHLAALSAVSAEEAFQALQSAYDDAAQKATESQGFNPKSPSPRALMDRRLPLAAVSSGSLNSRGSGQAEGAAAGDHKGMPVKRKVSNNAAAAAAAKAARTNVLETISFYAARSAAINASFDQSSDEEMDL